MGNQGTLEACGLILHHDHELYENLSLNLTLKLVAHQSLF